MTDVRKTCLPLVLCLALLGCDSNSSDGVDDEVISVAIVSSVGERSEWLMFDGQEVDIGVEALNESGETIEGAPVSWESSDPSLMTVSQTGRVTARATGLVTLTVRSGSHSDSREIEIYDVTGLWAGDIPGGGGHVTIDLVQNGETVTGTFGNSAWMNNTPGAGTGPLTGTLNWNRLSHSIDVAQGCIWVMTSVIEISRGNSGIEIKENESGDPWVINSTCGGGGNVAVPLMIRQ